MSEEKRVDPSPCEKCDHYAVHCRCPEWKAWARKWWDIVTGRKERP